VPAREEARRRGETHGATPAQSLAEAQQRLDALD
jgi:hypothetical protein